MFGRKSAFRQSRPNFKLGKVGECIPDFLNTGFAIVFWLLHKIADKEVLSPDVYKRQIMDSIETPEDLNNEIISNIQKTFADYQSNIGGLSRWF